MTLSLKTLLVPSKEVEVEVPGYEGFKVNVCFLSREVLQAIRKKATKTVMKGRTMMDDFDEDLFLKLFVESTVKGWSGLKLSYLEQLAPVDLTGQPMDAELEFTAENALFLMKNSVPFDNFISETVNDLGNFSTRNSKQ